MPTYEEIISNSVRRPRGYTYEGYPDTPAGQEYAPTINEILQREQYPNITPRTLYNVAGQESDFNPNLYTRSSGAAGLMQITPGTEQYLERSTLDPRGGAGYPPFDRYNPEEALDTGARYLSDISRSSGFQGDTGLAASGYNAGPAYVQRALRDAQQINQQGDAVPPDTMQRFYDAEAYTASPLDPGVARERRSYWGIGSSPPPFAEESGAMDQFRQLPTQQNRDWATNYPENVASNLEPGVSPQDMLDTPAFRGPGGMDTLTPWNRAAQDPTRNWTDQYGSFGADEVGGSASGLDATRQPGPRTDMEFYPTPQFGPHSMPDEQGYPWVGPTQRGREAGAFDLRPTFEDRWGDNGMPMEPAAPGVFDRFQPSIQRPDVWPDLAPDDTSGQPPLLRRLFEDEGNPYQGPPSEPSQTGARYAFNGGLDEISGASRDPRGFGTSRGNIGENDPFPGGQYDPRGYDFGNRPNPVFTVDDLGPEVGPQFDPTNIPVGPDQGPQWAGGDRHDLLGALARGGGDVGQGRQLFDTSAEVAGDTMGSLADVLGGLPEGWARGLGGANAAVPPDGTAQDNIARRFPGGFQNPDVWPQTPDVWPDMGAGEPDIGSTRIRPGDGFTRFLDEPADTPFRTSPVRLDRQLPEQTPDVWPDINQPQGNWMPDWRPGGDFPSRALPGLDPVPNAPTYDESQWMPEWRPGGGFPQRDVPTQIGQDTGPGGTLLGWRFNLPTSYDQGAQDEAFDTGPGGTLQAWRNIPTAQDTGPSGTLQVWRNIPTAQDWGGRFTPSGFDGTPTRPDSDWPTVQADQPGGFTGLSRYNLPSGGDLGDDRFSSASRLSLPNRQFVGDDDWGSSSPVTLHDTPSFGGDGAWNRIASGSSGGGWTNFNSSQGLTDGAYQPLQYRGSIVPIGTTQPEPAQNSGSSRGGVRAPIPAPPTFSQSGVGMAHNAGVATANYNRAVIMNPNTYISPFGGAPIATGSVVQNWQRVAPGGGPIGPVVGGIGF